MIARFSTIAVALLAAPVAWAQKAPAYEYTCAETLAAAACQFDYGYSLGQAKKQPAANAATCGCEVKNNENVEAFCSSSRDSGSRTSPQKYQAARKEQLTYVRNNAQACNNPAPFIVESDPIKRLTLLKQAATKGADLKGNRVLMKSITGDDVRITRPDGMSISSNGIKSAPSGVMIVTNESAAVVEFVNGTAIKLAPNSAIRLRSGYDPSNTLSGPAYTIVQGSFTNVPPGSKP